MDDGDVGGVPQWRRTGKPAARISPRAAVGGPPWSWFVFALAIGCAGTLGCSGDDTAQSTPQPDAGGGDGDGDAGGQSCAEGVVVCDGDTAKVCDGLGGFTDARDCAAEAAICVPSRIDPLTGALHALGCVQCVPGDASCSDDRARYCREDGSGYLEFDCDPEQGLVCETDGCKGACAPPEVTASYIGCDYYPTVTLNPVWQGFDFAVAIANASGGEAAIRITRGDQTVHTLALAKGELQVVPLPWVSALKGGDVDACQVVPSPGSTQRVVGGAYRVRSDRPVTVYQLSPLQYELFDAAGEAPAECPVGTDCAGGLVEQCLSYSNDATLLLPATTLGGDYTALSWASLGNSASFLSVTATADGTTVQVASQGMLLAGAGVAADGSGSVVLDRGDVLQLVADHTQAPGSDGYAADLSGSRITADKPVQVIGGNSCANIPTSATGYCDHVEHVQWPSEILGDDYVVSYPAAPSSTSPYLMRLAAVEADTEVTFEPAIHPPLTLQPGAPPVTVAVGEYGSDGQGTVIDEPPTDVRVRASGPLLIAQYLLGERAVPSGAGDPSMAMVAPVAQYRRDYTFVASTTYDRNYINLVVPDGVTPELDGVPVSGARDRVGSSDWSVMRVQLQGGDEVHRVTASEPFGLVVYGYGRYTSYMYPGGLDLRRIAVIAPQ